MSGTVLALMLATAIERRRLRMVSRSAAVSRAERAWAREGVVELAFQEEGPGVGYQSEAFNSSEKGRRFEGEDEMGMGAQYTDEK